MQAAIVLIIFVAIANMYFNRDRRAIDPAIKKLISEPVEAKSQEAAPERGKWAWTAVFVVVGLFVFAYWQQHTSAQDYQNAVDYTSCRKDVNNGLASASECEQVKSNNWIYAPR